MWEDALLSVRQAKIFDSVEIGDILRLEPLEDMTEHQMVLRATIIDDGYFFFPLSSVFKTAKVEPHTTSQALIQGAAEDIPYALEIGLRKHS